MRALTSVRIEGRAAGRIPRAHITSRVKELLKRLPVRPVSVRVTFGDVNGPKGGVDTRCGILVSLPGAPVIRVERMASTPRLAFDRAYEPVQRTTERPRRGWREPQGRPKKQYAAQHDGPHSRRRAAHRPLRGRRLRAFRRQHVLRPLRADPDSARPRLRRRTRPGAHALTWSGLVVRNLLPVTLGNIIGGTLLVGGTYWFVYLKPRGGRHE